MATYGGTLRHTRYRLPAVSNVVPTSYKELYSQDLDPIIGDRIDPKINEILDSYPISFRENHKELTPLIVLSVVSIVILLIAIFLPMMINNSVYKKWNMILFYTMFGASLLLVYHAYSNSNLSSYVKDFIYDQIKQKYSETVKGKTRQEIYKTRDDAIIPFAEQAMNELNNNQILDRLKYKK